MISIRFIYVSCKWLCLSILLALLDINTKYWIKAHLLVGDSFNVFPGINFYHINNSGIAFGLFSYVNRFYQWILTSIIILIIIIFFVALYKAVVYQLSYDSLSYAIIIGGSLGNLYDRILYGSVIDFIDCYINNWHWPIFNIADIEICIGLILLIIPYIMSSDKCIKK